MYNHFGMWGTLILLRTRFPSLKMSEMMLISFSGHVSLIILTANQKLCLVCVLLPYQNTNLIFSNILIKINVAKLLPNCKPANLYTLKITGVICLAYTKKSNQLSRQSRNRGCIKTVNVSALIPLCLCFSVLCQKPGRDSHVSDVKWFRQACVAGHRRGGKSNKRGRDLLPIFSRFMRSSFLSSSPSDACRLT